MRRHVWISILCVLLAGVTLWWGLNPVISTEAQVEANIVALVLDTDIGTGALQMKQGAKLAAKEQQVELLTAAPDYAGGLAISQAELLKQQIEKNVKAVILVPVKGEDLTGALLLAAERNVPVLTLGEGATDGEIACTIGGDSQKAGELAAQALLTRLETPGRILLITGEDGDDAAALRLSGALPVLKADGALSILLQTPLKGRTADDMLALMDAYPDLNGMLCLTGESTEVAAKAMGRRHQSICLVGMDCGQNGTTYLENRQVDAMVLGMPFAMGYLGVQFAVKALAGEKVPRQYFTESRVIDLENMYLPENQKLAFPLLQ